MERIDTYKIVPLTKDRVEEAVALQNRIFPSDKEGAEWIRMSVDREKRQARGAGKWKPRDFGYWILIDEGRMFGITGIYHLPDDDPKTAWVGWYGIDPHYRGKGLGEKLLRWTIEKAREGGNTALKLYTTTDPNEAAAQKLYEKIGLKIFKEEKEPGDTYTTLYREMKL